MEEYSNYDEYGDEYDETEPYTVKAAGIKYGIYLGIVGIVLALVQFMFGGTGNTILTIASVLISVVAVVFAHNEFKKNNEDFMSYSEGLGIGVLLSFISSVISSTFAVFYQTVIDTGFIQRNLERSRQELEDAGNYSDAEIEQIMSFAQQMSSPAIAFFVGILATVIFGLIISLVVSAFTKNKRPMFD